MKVYGLPEGQGLDRWNDMAQATGEGAISFRQSRPWPSSSPLPFIAPEAKISIAFSALNSHSVTSR